jgi:hypothetical protein
VESLEGGDRPAEFMATSVLGILEVEIAIHLMQIKVRTQEQQLAVKM